MSINKDDYDSFDGYVDDLQVALAASAQAYETAIKRITALEAENKRLRETLRTISEWHKLGVAGDLARKALEQERWTQAEIDAAKAEAEETSRLLKWGKQCEHYWSKTDE